MKRCLGLIAALGLATVASAANMTWSSTTVPGSQEIFGSSDAKADFALAVKITTTFSGQSLENSSMVTFGTSTRDDTAVGLLAYSAANGFGAHFDSATSNATTWTDNNSSLASGSHIVVINGTWDSTNNRWTVTLYINNGTTPITFNGNANPILEPTDGALTATFANNAAWTFNDAATYDGTLTTDEITKLVDAGSAIMPTNIPEPTALALLALGVAGVALRRRVA